MSDRIAAAQKEAEEEERRMAAAKARLERLSRKVSAPQTVDDGAGVVPTLASVEERAQAARTAAPDKAQTATATIGTAAASEQAAIEKANEAKEAAARAVAAARLAVDTAVAGADAFVVRQKVEEAAPLGVPAMTSTERAQQQEQVSSESLSEAWDGVTTQVQTSLADLSGRMHMCANQMMMELPPSMTKCISNVYDFGTPYSDDGSQYVRSPALTNGTPKRAPVREPEFFEWLFTCGSCASPRRSTDAAF